MRAPGGTSSGMQRNLRYLLESNIAPQWRDWIAALAPVLVDEIGEARAWDLMQRTGSAVARRRPLRPCETLAMLQETVEEELNRLNWGWAKFSVRGSGVDIMHGAYPFAPAPDDPAGSWFAAVLEGLYTEWLSALSGNPELTTIATVRPESVGDVILLRYARHGQLRLPL